MTYFKYKTIYNNQLIPCIIDPIRNAIYIHDESLCCGLDTIGFLSPYKKKDEKLPIFLYTNRLDRNGEEIYEGHLLRCPDFYPEYLYTFEYDTDLDSFRINIIKPENRNSLDTVFQRNARLPGFSHIIVGHISNEKS